MHVRAKKRKATKFTVSLACGGLRRRSGPFYASRCRFTATGDTTRPGIRDGVLLSESSGTLHFDFYSMIATGSDQLVQLTHRLAI